MTTAAHKIGLRSSLSALALAVARSAMAAGPSVPPGPPQGDIRDIRPLILIPPWWHSVWVPALIGVLLAALGLGLWLWRRHGKRPLTPEEKAQEALTRAETLARQGRCHEWADAVAGTLRAALAAKLGKDACPETTSELAAIDWAKTASGTPVDAPHLIELLSTCDLTRFAMARLDADSLVQATGSAREWITHLFAPPAPSASSAPEEAS